MPSTSELRRKRTHLQKKHPGTENAINSPEHKGLEGYDYIDGRCLSSVDGTGFFSSPSVNCDNCCEKHRRDGGVTYYHHMLCGAIVHPEHTEVFPLAPEQILKTDGAKKNDCERNAAKRFIEDLRREHPHMKFIALEDALESNAPHIRRLMNNDLRFMLGAKPGDHKYLFRRADSGAETREVEIEGEDGIRHRFRYVNNVSLNASNAECKVNFVEYHETRPGTRKNLQSGTTSFSRVADIPLERGNPMKIMRAGRARWRIENETFNTLKNRGYNFERNFGHGNRHLSGVSGNLMLLAFLLIR